MVATSLPDAQGRVSFGTAVGMTPAVLRRVPLAIAEQVPAMPVTAGDTLWPADAFSAVVVSNRALIEVAHPDHRPWLLDQARAQGRLRSATGK